LTASVFVDSDVIAVNLLNDIRFVVASAAGIDLERGDEIQVAAVPFDKADERLRAEAAFKAEQRQRMNLIVLGILVLLIILALLIYAFLRWRERRRAERLALEAARMAELSTEELLDQLTREEVKIPSEAEAVPEAEHEPEHEPVVYAPSEEEIALSEEIQRKQGIRNAVEDYTNNNPEEVARLVKSWMTEES